MSRLEWSFAASVPSSPHLTEVRTSRSSSKGTSTGRTPRRSSAFQTTPSGTRRPTRNIRSTGLSRRHSSQRDDLGETPRLKLCELRSEEHTSELQSLMRISYAVFCLKKKKKQTQTEKQKRIK